VLAAPASAAVTWREVSHGDSYEVQLTSPVTFLAADRADVKNFSRSLPEAALTKIGNVDFKKNVVVVVLAGWGCRHHRYTVSSVSQRGKRLSLVLAAQAMPPGTDCVMLATTYRALAVPKSQLRRPYPTGGEARIAGA
jgi:hypothetical protein